MKKLNYMKMGIDILMTVTFVLLFNKSVLGGLAFHEIAGLAIALVFITHILLNVQWVKRVSLRIFDRKLPGKTRFSYFFNLLLLVCMVFVIVSGVLVSHVLFPNIGIANEQWFKISHILVSILTLVIVGVHAGLHWQWVMQVTKNVLKLKSGSSGQGVRTAVRIAAAVILLFGSYEAYSSGFLTKLSGIGVVFGASAPSGMPAGGRGRPPEGAAGREQGTAAAAPQGERSSSGTVNAAEPAASGGAMNPGARGGAGGRGQGFGQSPSALGVLVTYLGIMAVFVILTYYLDMLVSRRKRRGSPGAGGVA